MSYQVIARRWRPQKFNQLISQDHITQTLQNSIKSGRISHAYIFTGPRGVGKTTTARLLAKTLNCIHGPAPEPCGQCENCTEITAGNSFDVIEIDGASNNGVDNIRELRETVHFAPVKSNYKIYIIDEVHMLSTGAFNALLKTLEEPPAHSIFIFATTEIHKVPDTILSRCQKFFFKKISPDAIVSHLSSIIKEEELELSDSSLFAIARSATGSMRDAQSLLEQVISFSNGEISDNDVSALLGIVPIKSYIQLLMAISNHSASEIIVITNQLFSTGIHISRYILGLKETIRALRFIKGGITIDEQSGFASTDIAEIQQLSAKFSDEEISKFFSILDTLSASLRFSDNESINLEMALLDMLAICKTPSISAILKKIEQMPEKKNFEIVSTAEENHAIKPLSLKQGWNELLIQISSTKKYLFEQLNQYAVHFLKTHIDLQPKESTNSIISEVSESDKTFLQSELCTACAQSITIAFHLNKDPEPPLPEKQMVRHDSQEEAEKTLDQNHPLVGKVLEIFHGEVIKQKGDR